jgi:hypothetical protein
MLNAIAIVSLAFPPLLQLKTLCLETQAAVPVTLSGSITKREYVASTMGT